VVPILLLALVAAAPTTVSAKRSRILTHPVYRTPIDVSPYGLPFVDVFVNGRPARALLDTGSFRGVELSSRLATELGLALAPTGRVAKRHDGKSLVLQEARLVSFTIGGMRREDVAASVVEGDVERISERVSTPFDVILGWEFLSRYSLLVDYRERTLRWSLGRLSDAVPRRAAGVTTVPVETVKGVPVVAGFVGADSVRFLVDTGAPTCNLDATIAGAPTGDMIERNLRIGTEAMETSCRVKDLSVVRESLNCAAVLGNNLFTEWRLYYESRSATITFVRR
jgi:hypothetical protein